MRRSKGAEQHGLSTDIGQTEQQENKRRAVEGSEDADAHLVVLDLTTACPLEWLRTQHCTARPPDVARSDGGPRRARQPEMRLAEAVYHEIARRECVAR